MIHILEYFLVLFTKIRYYFTVAEKYSTLTCRLKCDIAIPNLQFMHTFINAHSLPLAIQAFLFEIKEMSNEWERGRAKIDHLNDSIILCFGILQN